MADMTDEEQLQVLKNWWKENGKSLVLTISAILIAYFGWQWWKNYQQDYSEKASAIYSELAEVVSSVDGLELDDEKQKTALFLIEQLQNDYSRTLYAVNASLLAAKLAVDEGDLASAEEQLKKAIDKGDEDTNALTSLRLARVYIAQEKFDDALVLSSYDKEDEFTGLFAVVRGDAYAAKGAIEDATAAYTEALEKLSASNSLQRRMVEIKMSDLVARGE